MSDTKAKGYKGHRTGSAREKAHKLIDENPKAERKDLIPKIVKFGVEAGTAANWISVFRKGGGKAAKATKPTAVKKPEVKKAAPKPAAVQKKPVVKAKTAPVIKQPAPATAGAASPAA